MRFLFALILAAALSGCGFHLRGSGSAQLPYKTMYIALRETSDINIWLQRHIRATRGTEIVSDPNQAEAIFQQVSDGRQKIILSVNAKGRVREYRLQLTYVFQLVNAKGQVIVPENEINLTRDVTYDDSSILAKELEEGLLWRDINNDLVEQIMRRLSRAQPRDPNQDDNN